MTHEVSTSRASLDACGTPSGRGSLPSGPSTPAFAEGPRAVGFVWRGTDKADAPDAARLLRRSSRDPAAECEALKAASPGLGTGPPAGRPVTLSPWLCAATTAPRSVRRRSRSFLLRAFCSTGISATLARKVLATQRTVDQTQMEQGSVLRRFLTSSLSSLSPARAVDDHLHGSSAAVPSSHAPLPSPLPITSPSGGRRWALSSTFFPPRKLSLSPWLGFG
mmetsp:Transcript_4028/g.11642  ORF Transcript_4028/g.11642 Transcript_4028/m.11642 type:complete len:221 (+) Transcript_4028:1407-2069(+)